jgi:hypothetical protein
MKSTVLRVSWILMFFLRFFSITHSIGKMIIVGKLERLQEGNCGPLKLILESRAWYVKPELR